MFSSRREDNTLLSTLSKKIIFVLFVSIILKRDFSFSHNFETKMCLDERHADFKVSKVIQGHFG